MKGRIMTQSIRKAGFAALMIMAGALVACGGDDDSSKSSAKSKGKLTAGDAARAGSADMKGDRAFVTIEGGAMDGSYIVPLAKCVVDGKVNVNSEMIDGSAFLWVFGGSMKDTAGFQINEGNGTWFSNAQALKYTVEGGTLTGSGGVLDTDDGGKLSVKIICE